MDEPRDLVARAGAARRRGTGAGNRCSSHRAASPDRPAARRPSCWSFAGKPKAAATVYQHALQTIPPNTRLPNVLRDRSTTAFEAVRRNDAALSRTSRPGASPMCATQFDPAGTASAPTMVSRRLLGKRRIYHPAADLPARAEDCRSTSSIRARIFPGWPSSKPPPPRSAPSANACCARIRPTSCRTSTTRTACHSISGPN